MCYRNMIRSRNSPPALTTVVMEMEVLGCWHGSRCILFMLLLAMKHLGLVLVFCQGQLGHWHCASPARKTQTLEYAKRLHPSGPFQQTLSSHKTERLQVKNQGIGQINLFLQLHVLFEVLVMPPKIISQTE